MPIRNNELYCKKCDKRINQPYVVRYKGEDFHKSCFITETAATDIEKNPYVKMSLDPRTVKVMLDAMENYLDSSEVTGKTETKLYGEVKRVYPNIAVRLAQAGRGIGQCSHCGRARYFENMIKGGKSKEKILDTINTILTMIRTKEVKVKHKEEKMRVLLFCDDSCDQLFTARPLNERIPSYEELRNQVLLKVRSMNPEAAKEADAIKERAKRVAEQKKIAAKEKRQRAERVLMQDKQCVECCEHHVTFECDDCGAWLGSGKCTQNHQRKHVLDEEERLAKEKLSKLAEVQLADHEAEIREILREYDLEKLHDLKETAKSLAETNGDAPIEFEGAKISANEWHQVLIEVITVKNRGVQQ